MSTRIQDNDGNLFDLVTDQADIHARTDAPLKFKTEAEALTFVRRLEETAAGHEQLRRMVAEVESQRCPHHQDADPILR